MGQKLSYDVSHSRLCNVIERTTRGLYLHEFGQRLPDDHRSKVWAIGGFDLAVPAILAQIQKFWGHAASGKRRDFGENVFTYWVRKIDGPEDATVWDFLVYGSVAFLAVTGPGVGQAPPSVPPMS